MSLDSQSHVDGNKGIYHDPREEEYSARLVAAKIAKISKRPLAEVEKEFGLEPSEDDQQ